MHVGATGFTAFGALPAAATAVCNDIRPCFACVLDEFVKEKTQGQTEETQRHYKLFSVLLTQYVNTFGAAWLFSQGAMPTIESGRRRTEPLAPVEKYTPGEVARLLRGFALFYVLFKVEAPDEIINVWLDATVQLYEFLVERGHVSRDVVLSLEPCSDEDKINALCGAGLIIQTAEKLDADEDRQQDVRYGEPFYMVSRVAAGKLWFLHSTAKGKCADFGPVTVPPGVENFIKPGWCLDCRFVRLAVRWFIIEMNGVMPV